MNLIPQTLHDWLKILGKLMISLSDQAEDLVRHEVERMYHGRVGGLSIFFEQVLRSYFTTNGKHTKPQRVKNGRN
jgi:hypothetical protein